jgi:hypothetical protein
MFSEIHVKLLSEGVDVWRPVPALKLPGEANIFAILRPSNFDELSETWEFPPGSVVDCEPRSLVSGAEPVDRMVAIRLPTENELPSN